jgi:peptidase E
MTRMIIALGGGGFSMEASPHLDNFIIAAARKSDPRVLFVPTALRSRRASRRAC